MSIFRTADPRQDFNDWDDEQNSHEDCPICSVCGEPITEEQWIEYEGDFYHLDGCSDDFLERVKAEYTVTKTYFL